MKGEVLLLLGSKSDMEFSRIITQKLDLLGIRHQTRIASAHRTPNHLLRVLDAHKKRSTPTVIITIAGLSDALSGIAAFEAMAPVIACPPDLEEYGFAKLFSSAYTPNGVPVALIAKPENAALFAARILALADEGLARKLTRLKDIASRDVVEADLKLRKGQRA